MTLVRSLLLGGVDDGQRVSQDGGCRRIDNQLLPESVRGEGDALSGPSGLIGCVGLHRHAVGRGQDLERGRSDRRRDDVCFDTEAFEQLHGEVWDVRR